MIDWQDVAASEAPEGGIALWLKSHDTLLWWLIGGSIASLVLCVLLLPVIVVRLDADYFVKPRQELMVGRSAGEWIWHIAKNLLGAILVIVGVVFLFTPGQGVLTMFIGLLFLEFPGKRALELRIVKRPKILALLNGMRQKRGHAPFVVEKDTVSVVPPAKSPAPSGRETGG